MEYDEKRQFARTAANCRMNYRPVGSAIPVEGTCIDISGSGILFRGDSPLTVGKAAELHLLPENPITPPLTAYIEVVRCERDQKGESYRIAGAIKGIKSE